MPNYAAGILPRQQAGPGGYLQFADIANGRPVPPEALRDIDLWTG